MIPYGRHEFDGTENAAVADVLASGWISQGPAVESFESEICAATEARHAVAFSSGTAALHAAAAACGIGHGSRVATSSLSFVASANCARYVGADVEFVDIDPNTLNMALEDVSPATDALVAVHYAGLPVDWQRLAVRPAVVIEDAAHALGAATPDGPVGNCARSDVCVFSLHPVKSITSAEGGVATTNSDDAARAMRAFRNGGMERRPGLDPWAYEIRRIGFNYRMSDVHAAIGGAQIKRLSRFITRRNTLADRYDRLLADLPVTRAPRPQSGTRHARHLYPIRVDHRRTVYERMHARGVGVQVHYVPIHHQPLYHRDGHGDAPSVLVHTEAAYARLLSLPLYPSLTFTQQDVIAEALSEALTEA
ncbi:MAG TPA: DegT/DnrJ/EryC1/StrS family aminotransferase [Microthrixaceae bacterium]|nr:DegT/DnrJ/EryC1/StrS family aminotransferase [Microthrixaceae bacterium]